MGYRSSPRRGIQRIDSAIEMAADAIIDRPVLSPAVGIVMLMATASLQLAGYGDTLTATATYVAGVILVAGPAMAPGTRFNAAGVSAVVTVIGLLGMNTYLPRESYATDAAFEQVVTTDPVVAALAITTYTALLATMAAVGGGLIGASIDRGHGALDRLGVTG